MGPWMFRPRHRADDDPDAAVQATVARLRASVVAAATGSAAFLALGLMATHMAFVAGVERGQSSGAEAAGSFPAFHLLALVTGGFVALGIVLVFVVRAPFDRARDQAIDLTEANKRLADATLETFAALGAAVEAKDRYTAGHGLRVTLVSILIGQELGLDQRELDVLRHAATFHDVGKIAVPDDVLNKPGRLSDSEFEAMKVHPAEGARICSKLQVLRPAVPLIRSHHERMDGRGYPDNLVAEQIPLGARIIAVADTWDAITSDRPYREGQPAFVALEEIRRCTGAQFDERVVRAFVEVLAKDPWMFGLTPEDVADRRPLPAPMPASRGVDADRDGYADTRRSDLVTRVRDEIDWSEGFDEDDLRAA
jgi:HD-GYP domain-containing protein (c-di-GMP phosphodiesterase class II)